MDIESDLEKMMLPKKNNMQRIIFKKKLLILFVINVI